MSRYTVNFFPRIRKRISSFTRGTIVFKVWSVINSLNKEKGRNSEKSSSYHLKHYFFASVPRSEVNDLKNRFFCISIVHNDLDVDTEEKYLNNFTVLAPLVLVPLEYIQVDCPEEKKDRIFFELLKNSYILLCDDP